MRRGRKKDRITRVYSKVIKVLGIIWFKTRVILHKQQKVSEKEQPKQKKKFTKYAKKKGLKNREPKA